MNQGTPLLGMRILVVEDDYYLATDELQMLQSAARTSSARSATPKTLVARPFQTSSIVRWSTSILAADPALRRTRAA